MSKYYKNKTSNDDLISIYRMDFYKKKKNWKYTNDVKKVSSKPQAPRRESVTSLLNVTYDVDPQEQNNPEELEDFNNAFKEIDFNVYQQEHDSPKELNNLNDAFIAVDSDLDPQEPDSPKELIYLNNEPTEIDLACYDMPLQQDYHLGTVDDLFILPQYPSPHHGLQLLSPELGQYRQVQWPQQFMNDGENVIDGTFPVLEKSTNSLESSTEFIRGAHCAPHSSELQLNIPDVPQSDLSTEALARLPNKVLYALLQRHRNMVQLLLKEARARMRVQSESLSLENYQYYTSDISSDIPTRDIGPYAYTDIDKMSMQREDFQKPDYFLAGSSQIGRGRGRGRFIDNSQLVGLGRGRKIHLNNF